MSGGLDKKGGKIELDPCPFCLGEAGISRTRDVAQWYYVECSRCYTRQLASQTRTEAARRWNTRGPNWSWSPRDSGDD